MHCEFCDTTIKSDQPENVALLQHVAANDTCGQQYDYLLQNLRSSWTPNMSGG